MANFLCVEPGCGRAFLTIAGLRDHYSNDHGLCVCIYGDCTRSLKNNRALNEHYEEVHLGFRYACSNCGTGGWKRRNYASTQRKSNQACIGAQTLQLRPNEGVFHQGVLYGGPLHANLVLWNQQVTNQLVAPQPLVIPPVAVQPVQQSQAGPSGVGYVLPHQLLVLRL